MTPDPVDARVQRLTEARRRSGRAKEEACLEAIEVLTANGNPVNFSEVQRAASVSSWFTYNNATVRAAIERSRALPRPTNRRAADRADPDSLRADLADARHEVSKLRAERDKLNVRVRQGLGAVIEQRDLGAVVERAESAERQRDVLRAELHEARVQLKIANDNNQLLREELEAARAAVKRVMRTPLG